MPRRAGTSRWISTDSVFTQIGGDGGLQEYPETSETLVIWPPASAPT